MKDNYIGLYGLCSCIKKSINSTNSLADKLKFKFHQINILMSVQVSSRRLRYPKHVTQMEKTNIFRILEETSWVGQTRRWEDKIKIKFREHLVRTGGGQNKLKTVSNSELCS